VLIEPVKFPYSIDAVARVVFMFLNSTALILMSLGYAFEVINSLALLA
jgi:hypothetical protein